MARSSDDFPDGSAPSEETSLLDRVKFAVFSALTNLQKEFLGLRSSPGYHPRGPSALKTNHPATPELLPLLTSWLDGGFSA